MPHADIAQRIIEAASEVFARHGFAASRVRDIVRTADVNLAAVNYYFGGKEGLYAATLKQLASHRNAGWQGFDPGATPEEALFHHVLAVVNRVMGAEADETLGRIIAHEAMSPTPYFDQVMADVVQPELERLESIVRQLSPKAPEPQVSMIAMSVLGQCLFYLYARGAVNYLAPTLVERSQARKLAEHITKFSMAAIRGLGTGH